MASTTRNVSMRLLAPGDAQSTADVMTYVPYKKAMVSMRTLTWTFILMQLVISCACFIASLAIISAKFNSVSVYEDKQYVSFEWWIFCGLSFSMIINTIAAMYALSEHNRFLLIPHILVLMKTPDLNKATKDISRSKTCVCFFLGLQFLVACYLLLGSVPASIDDETQFAHEQSRPITHILLTLTLIWFISIPAALCFVIRDQYKYLRYHIHFNSVIFLIYLIKQIILFLGGDMSTMVFCTCVNAVNFLAIFFEIQLLTTY
ncbi:hypothetical protein CAEBREN_20736 [Caenorhabditis brenneri]|uniref:Uncharacterized protein n=1 Tax=Caenorhabditis brenneri TaxID=135651 RepID=G0N4V4_CAEBE|nr:hypothetical protein CAEBREN_20736 [Caenorhabditis brenneri]